MPMESVFHGRVDWKLLFGRSRFQYIFVAMFISLFGTGMNYAGVTWYILEQTNSTLNVSWMLILVTLPGLIVPPFGGVLIDRVDRRHLAVILDLARGVLVLGTAALAEWGHARLWHVYGMVTLLGIGFAVYWSTMNALTQEVIARADATDTAHVPRSHLASVNAAVLIAVQAGMMTAGASVGFLYERLGIAGILAIDGATYLTSALCLLLLRSGHFPPPRHAAPGEPRGATEAPANGEMPREPVLPTMVEPTVVEPGMNMFLADLREGLHYLAAQPRVFALGLTYACMMAGVISSHVLIVVLARDILQSGPRGYGYLESGWAIGAVLGGVVTSALVRKFRALASLVVALATLAAGHAMFPYVTWLPVAVAMMVLFGGCRALGGVVTQTSIMSTVPPRLMGRTQSAFSVISTLLQILMSFTLGWLAQHVNLPVAFAVLGSMYAGAALAAFRTRGSTSAAPVPAA